VEGWLAEAGQQQPESLSLQFDVATLAMFQQKYQEAEAIYGQLAVREPSNPAVLDNHAWLLALQGVRLEEALVLINRCLAVSGPNAEVLNTRAMISIALKRPQEAINDLSRAIELGAAPTMYFHLAQALALTPDREGAMTALENARKAGLVVEALHPLQRAAYGRLNETLGGGPASRQP